MTDGVLLLWELIRIIIFTLQAKEVPAEFVLCLWILDFSVKGFKNVMQKKVDYLVNY